ncbi:MAG: YegP family protein [Tannerella sp.]|jgi:uncharacterized protein YegP (UPF0339 family)|nr:YegP family protein [Tannerella sp.]
MAKFEITKRKNGEFQYNLKASNGEIILTSEGYVAKASCVKGINSVIKNSTEEQRFEKRVAKNSKYFFILKAKNGQVIGTSEMYESEATRDKGIASVKKNASSAKIADMTKK